MIEEWCQQMERGMFDRAEILGESILRQEVRDVTSMIKEDGDIGVSEGTEEEARRIRESFRALLRDKRNTGFAMGDTGVI